MGTSGTGDLGTWGLKGNIYTPADYFEEIDIVLSEKPKKNGETTHYLGKLFQGHSGGMGIWDMVTWGLGGLWHGDFRTGDLGNLGTQRQHLHSGGMGIRDRTMDWVGTW